MFDCERGFPVIHGRAQLRPTRAAPPQIRAPGPVHPGLSLAGPLLPRVPQLGRDQALPRSQQHHLSRVQARQDQRLQDASPLQVPQVLDGHQGPAQAQLHQVLGQSRRTARARLPVESSAPRDRGRHCRVSN
jgi:hypothetical protein